MIDFYLCAVAFTAGGVLGYIIGFTDAKTYLMRHMKARKQWRK